MTPYSIPLKTPLRSFAGPFFCALFLFIWCHGSSIFHFTMIPDEELRFASASAHNVAWLADGRWGVYFLKSFFASFLINPFYTAVLAAVFVAAATALIHHALLSAAGRPTGSVGSSGLVLATLLSTSPVFAFVLTFSTFDSEIGAAILLAVIAAMCSFNTLFNTRRHLTQLGAVSLLLLSFSVYQPMLIIWGLLTLALLLAYLVLHPDPVRPLLPIRRLAYLATAPVLALIVDKVLQSMLVLFVKPNGYLDQFSGWSHSTPREIVSRLLLFWHNVLFGGFFSPGYGWRLGLAVGALSIAFIAFRALRSPQRFTASVIALALCTLPFSLSLALGGQVPMRTLFPFAFALALPPSLAYLALHRQLARVPLMGIAVFIALLNAQWINHIFLSDFRRYEHDRFIGEQIGLRLSVLCADSQQTQLPVALVGEIRADAKVFGYKCEAIGASLFEWDGGNPYRIVSFLNALGFDCVTGPTHEQLKQAIELSQNMKSWPATGSIIRSADFVIVKLSDATPQQIAKFSQ